MASQLCVQPTKFVNYDLKGQETDATWGIRIYDDYGKHYNNLFSSLDEVLESIKPKKILKTLEDLTDQYEPGVLDDMIQSIHDNKK
ncbi:MAG: hypothetical protein R3321_09980, partial [Nitrososphaeraceae archaeon]|nr:hypothetical protein [Nitrososphaeraceae archaeon]